MSTSKLSTRSWWAVSSTRARLTVLGASILVLALVATSVIVWLSPANPIAQAASAKKVDSAQAALMDERNQLLSQIVDLKDDLASKSTDLSSTKAELASIQQQLWAAEGKIEADAASGAPSTKTPTTKAPTIKKPATVKTPVVKPGTTPVTAPTKAELLNPSSAYFGMYTEQAPFNWATYDATAAKIGSSPNVVGYFSGWDETFRASAVTRAWQRGALPLLTWESRPIKAGNDEVNAPAYSLPKIIGDPENGVPGDFDDYLHQYAKDIVATGLPLAIRLDHEMNGVWYPWSETDANGKPINGNRVGDYAKMWRHVHDIFQAEGANDLVIWLWAPNVVNNIPAGHATTYYTGRLFPGDDYVDWVGVSGYLRAPFKADNDFSFDYTFGRTLKQLRNLSDKPIMLAEIGATEIGEHKSVWVTSLFDSLNKPENADIVGFSWFNLAITSYVGGERATNDWRIDSRSDSLAAFKVGLGLPDSRFALDPIP